VDEGIKRNCEGLLVRFDEIFEEEDNCIGSKFIKGYENWCIGAIKG